MATKTIKSSSPAVTMAELLASKTSSGIRGFSRGQKIEATLIEIGKHRATFDVGGKSEGVLLDAYFSEARDLVSTLKPGQTVNATVIDPETSDGAVLLSLRHAANDRFWEKLEKARESGEPITVIGKAASSKGITVEVDSAVAFIPAGQVGKAKSGNLEELVGKRFRAKVVDVDKAKRKIMLSEKAVSEEKEMAEIEEAVKSLQGNQIYEGIVKEVTTFGAFVEIPVKIGKKSTTVEGLVHVSEMSWQKVKDPSEVLSAGDKIKVKVMGLRDGKLALSLKHAVEDPWEKAGDKYAVDQRLTGKVARSSDFGMFVELEPGIEGLIHITKIPPATKLTTGQEVNVYIEEIDVPSRKISLGLVLTSKPVGYK